MIDYQLRGKVAKLEATIRCLLCSVRNNNVEIDPIFAESAANNITDSNIEFLQSLDYNSLNNKPDNSTDLLYTSDIDYTVELKKPITMLTLDGESTNIYLPKIEEAKGLILIVFNDSGSPSNLICDSSDGDGLWEGGMDFNTISIGESQGRNIMNNGRQYKILT